MKGKNTSREAYIQRLKQLGDINPKNNLSESKSDGIGELENFKKASNGINYGIIKENQKYYIKKGGSKENPNASDFTYIGGLGNKVDYQYNTLSEADKNRNMILQSINEGGSYKLDNKTNKMRLSEEKITEKDEEGSEEETPTTPKEKIEKAEDKLDNLEDKTEKEVEPEAPADLEDDIPLPDEGGEEETPEPEEGGNEEIPEPEEGGEEETPEPEGGDDMPNIDDLDLGGEEETPEPEEGGEEETPEPEEGGEEETPEPDTSDEKPKGEKETPSDEVIEDIQSRIGSIIELVEQYELEPGDLKWFINTYLDGFKEKIANLEIEERKEMANKILKAGVSDDDIQDLEGVEDSVEETKETCNECGGFSSFLESKGYTLESVLECGNEEMANNISEYANAHAEGLNEGDFENVSKYMNDEIRESLLNEYLHEDYINEMDECGDKKIYESEEDRIAEIKEMWESYDTNHVETQPNLKTDQSDIINEEENEEDEKETDNEDVDDVPGPEDIDLTKPNEEEKGFDFAPPADNLGVDTVKPDGAPTTSTDINVDGENKTVNISMAEQKLRKYVKQRIAEKKGLAKTRLDESKKTSKMKKLDEMIDREMNNHQSEQKLRKYVRTRLEEMSGKRKPVLSESKKSNKLKKLDKMIAEQFDLAKKLHQDNKKK